MFVLLERLGLLFQLLMGLLQGLLLLGRLVQQV